MNGQMQQHNTAVQMVLKCADIGHLAADPKTHKRWAYQLEEEFFRQVTILFLADCSSTRAGHCALLWGTG